MTGRQSVWWVRMTVSTKVTLDHDDQAGAMQAGCDLLHQHVLDGDLVIHDVTAIREDDRYDVEGIDTHVR